MKRTAEYRKLITSKQWVRLRREKLAACPFCEECLKQGVYRSATEVHHVQPIESGGSPEARRQLAFDRSNLMALCHECHLAIHRRLGFGTVKEKRQRQQADNEEFRKKFL